MKTLITSVAALAFAVFSATAWSEEAAPEETGPLAASNFTGTVWLTNQYMFRGISNSDGPAVQGSVDWTYNGFFLGAWGSNTEFSDGNLEIDYYGGYRWSWSGLDFTLQGIYYSYPGEDDDSTEGLDPGFGVETDYGEVNVGIAHTFEGSVAPSIGLNWYYSPDAFGEDGENHTVQGSLGLTLPGDFGLYGNVGWTDFEGDMSTEALGGYDYVYFSVGISKVVKGFKLDLGYYGTDESTDLENVYVEVPGDDNFRDLIEGEVVFTVSRSF